MLPDSFNGDNAEQLREPIRQQGTERIGGVIVLDVTDPQAPVIVRFIPSQHSPTGQPLLAVANEITGRVNLFSLASRS